MEVHDPPPPLPFPKWIRYPLLIPALIGFAANLALHLYAWDGKAFSVGLYNNLPQAIALIVVSFGAMLFLHQGVKKKQGESIAARRTRLLYNVRSAPLWRIVAAVIISVYLVTTLYDPQEPGADQVAVEYAPLTLDEPESYARDLLGEERHKQLLTRQRQTTSYYLLGYSLSLLILIPVFKKRKKEKGDPA